MPGFDEPSRGTKKGWLSLVGGEAAQGGTTSCGRRPGAFLTEAGMPQPHGRHLAGRGVEAGCWGGSRNQRPEAGGFPSAAGRRSHDAGAWGRAPRWETFSRFYPATEGGPEHGGWKAPSPFLKTCRLLWSQRVFCIWNIISFFTDRARCDRDAVSGLTGILSRIRGGA
jgi:hypothetical protein